MPRLVTKKVTETHEEKKLRRAKKKHARAKQEYLDIQKRLQCQLKWLRKIARIYQGPSNEDGVPCRYQCPITHQLMRDPVIALDGHTYERAQIEAWYQTCRNNGRSPNSPMTRACITDHLIPSLDLKNEIAEWKHFMAREAYEKCLAANHPESDNEQTLNLYVHQVALKQATHEAKYWEPDGDDSRVTNAHCIEGDEYPWWEKTCEMLKARWIQVRAKEICDNRRRNAMARWGKIFVLFQARLSDQAEMRKQLLPGTRVQLHSLQTREDLNGLLGEVVRRYGPNRYHVRLGPANYVAVRRANMIV